MSIEPKIVTEGFVELEPWRRQLLEAADVIRQQGLAKGELLNEDGYCSMGALNKVVNGSSRYHYLQEGSSFRDVILSNQEATEKFADFLHLDREEMHAASAVAVWNNAKERTAEEVISAMEACALA
jgi:hypothetical protein